jgi:nitrogen-specific signal transduction histidine kinase
VLAHELRNPLAPLNHGLQIIRQGVNGSYAVEAAYQMMERQLA